MSTEELLQDPLAAPQQVEIDDLSALTQSRAGVPSSQKTTDAQTASPPDEDCIEIELTAEQIDALLGGQL